MAKEVNKEKKENEEVIKEVKKAKKESKPKTSTNKKNTQKSFFKDFKAELKKVSWPTFKQLVNNTGAVLAIVFIFAIIVFVLDVVFDLINEKGINKLKSNVKQKVVIENNIETNTDQNNVETNSAEGEAESQENSVTEIGG